MGSAVWGFITEVYGDTVSSIKDLETHFFRGFWFIVLWAFIIVLAAAFIYSFFWKWSVPVGIIIILGVIELLVFVGKKLEKPKR